jgi:hypothetical protein
MTASNGVLPSFLRSSGYGEGGGVPLSWLDWAHHTYEERVVAADGSVVREVAEPLTDTADAAPLGDPPSRERLEVMRPPMTLYDMTTHALFRPCSTHVFIWGTS